MREGCEDPQTIAAARLATQRYMHDDSSGAYAVRVQCCQCGKMRQLAHLLADREGEAFVDYYCPEHLGLAS